MKSVNIYVRLRLTSIKYFMVETKTTFLETTHLQGHVDTVPLLLPISIDLDTMILNYSLSSVCPERNERKVNDIEK